MNHPDTQPFDELTPDTVLDLVDQCGFRTDGRLLALNSYENRVYQVGVEDASPVIAKIYRPGRWADECIIEEHQYTAHLADLDIPVVPPLVCQDSTLHRAGPYRFAIYPRQGGREPELESDEHLAWMGRLLGRIHAVGRQQAFSHRISLTPKTYGLDQSEFLLAGDWIPDFLTAKFEALYGQLLEAIENRYALAGRVAPIRVHGDCHRGNVLWTDAGPHCVDFDDTCMAPAIQDLWMMLDGNADRQRHQLDVLLEGYEQFVPFDPAELHLIEALRTLRMINYAAWLARRWSDPAFPRSFPWFGQPRYWEEHFEALTEQLSALHEPTIQL